MDHFPHQAGANDQHVDWHAYLNPEVIPDDMIDPELLATSNQNDVAADQTSAHQQPPQQPPQQQHQPPTQSSQSNALQQTSVHHDQRPYWQRYNSQLNEQLTLPFQDGGVYQHPRLDADLASPFFDPQASSQVLAAFNLQPSYQGHSPTRDRNVHQQQPWIPQPYRHIAFVYPQSPPPQDGRMFFRQAAAAAASPSPQVHPPLMSRSNASVPLSLGTLPINQDSVDRANVQYESPTRNRSQSFSRGFGQGPMEVDDNRPFPFQPEADSSPLSSLAPTPTPALADAAVALPSEQQNTEMSMDLGDWDSGRETLVGLPSSSPPRVEASNNNNSRYPTPRCTHARQTAVEEQTEGLETLLASALAEPAHRVPEGSSSANGTNGTANVSGPQTGESSLHSQYLNAQAAGNVFNNLQPAASGDERVEAMLDEVRASNQLLEVANTLVDQIGDSWRVQQQQKKQQQVSTSTQTDPLSFNGIQLIPAVAPAIRSPLMISPYPLRIPGTFTPAILSLAIDPPRSLNIGTADYLQSYLEKCGIVPYNDVYPRTYPTSLEPFNRTIVVDARYLSVIGLLYPRAEFIVARIAEEAGEQMVGNSNCYQKIDPNSVMMMDKWHMYKVVRMTGEEMQKLGVCVWSEKGCEEWKPVEDKKVKRRRMEVVVEDDEEEGYYDSDATLVASDEAMKSAGKENVRPTVEEYEEGEVHQSVKGKGKEKEVADMKDMGKAVLQEKDGNDNAAAPFASKASTPALTPLRRSARVKSQQASAVAETPDRDKGNDNETVTPKPIITTRKLHAIQLDEPGESSAAAAAATPSRPIKIPKPRLHTTKPIRLIRPVVQNTVPNPDPSPVDRNLDPRGPDPTARYRSEASTTYLITLTRRDWPSGGIARIRLTPGARQTIEYIQHTFSVQHPFEVWRQKDYKVRYGNTPGEGEIKKQYVKIMRGYAGDENTEEGNMRLFMDEMSERYGELKEKEEGEEAEKRGDMSTLEEREAWKEKYLALRRRGARYVERARRNRKPGEDMFMDYDEWKEDKREEDDELCEEWFNDRSGLVEEEDLARKIVEFTMFEYAGGDGMGLSQA